jgi:AAA domain
VRVAITGTHGSGKSTLVEDFLAAHPDYLHEPEPYEALSEAGEVFSDPPTIADLLCQLDHSVERLGAHADDGNVILERCPVDFLAYLEVFGRGANPEEFEAGSVMEMVEEAIGLLDLIVFLPLPPGDAMRAERPALQRAVDRELGSILRGDALSLPATGGPRVIEVMGTPAQRLAALEQAVSGA